MMHAYALIPVLLVAMRKPGQLSNLRKSRCCIYNKQHHAITCASRGWCHAARRGQQLNGHASAVRIPWGARRELLQLRLPILLAAAVVVGTVAAHFQVKEMQFLVNAVCSTCICAVPVPFAHASICVSNQQHRQHVYMMSSPQA